MSKGLDKQIKKEELLINLDRKKTNLEKASFINEIKSGLGDEIKANPNTVEFIRPTKNNFKFLKSLKKLFKLF